MDSKKIAAQLHPLERAVLPHIGERISLSDLQRASGRQEVEVMRALQWLANKGIVTLASDTKEVAVLGANGIEYSKSGLPEMRFLQAVEREALPLADIGRKACLRPDELNISVGVLKGKAAIELRPGPIISITEAGRRLLGKDSLEMAFLKKLANLGKLCTEGLSPEERFALDALKKRKDIIIVDIEKTWTARITEDGQAVIGECPETRVQTITSGANIVSSSPIGRLTPEILKSGEWKERGFRPYDVTINVPAMCGGRRHFVSEAIEYIRRIWLDMGFVEMQGNMVQTAFWDLDALFVPQDHPAREMQDTFYLKDPARGKLPALLKRIKEVHENGADTGSTGWGGSFSKDISSQNLIRTHTTVLSAQTISRLSKDDLPAKFFTVGKVFRNEALDWKHLFEFFQVEGIVIDPDANLANLKGYLREFFGKMGFLDVRMRPAHFPYTEPSMEVDVLHPEKKTWVELGGAGIFRPEVVQPLLGLDVPVLAWGLGMDRIIKEYFALTDVRDLYKNDLKQIKEMKSWMR